MTEPVWRPSQERIEASAIAAYAREKGFEPAAIVEEFWRWTVDNPETFWSDVWRLGEVRASREADRVLVDGDRMPGARWFEGAELNFAENLLRRDDDEAAIIFRGENGERRELSWKDLNAEVAGLAEALARDGVGKGDRVAGYLPNIPETVIGMLASAALGAIWSSTSPDFGVDGVLDRFGQIEPEVLLTVDGYHYNGKRLDIRDKVEKVVDALPSLKRTVVCPFLDPQASVGDLKNGILYRDYLKGDARQPRYTAVAFDHPLYILYSSGTTGKPKAIVHSTGGALLQHLKEHKLHCDIRPGDRVFYFTTCGWMMWNWLASALASEATLVLFDGAPTYPEVTVLWDVAQDERIAVFGTSAKWIDACKKAGARPRDSHDLSSLKSVLSTGSPLVPESFDYVYDAVKPDLQLSSISGGTDIVSCFVLGNPAGPVYRGEIQMRGLGLAVDVWNEEGQPVRGEKGELVCTKPFPAMPVSFWNDPDGSRYHGSYFDRFEGIWCHGDYAEITERGGVVIHGRSDAVLNPGGVRIGTAEIYRQVEQIEEVMEAICIGQDWQGDVRVVLFVKLREDAELDDTLRDRIKKQIRANCTPRHVPARILEVDDIPRTMNGKITEVAVRDAVHGRKVKNTEALANPEALRQFEDRPELRS